MSGEGQVLLVDCGASSLVALKAQGLDPGAVDAVAVTHLHGDHFGGHLSQAVLIGAAELQGTVPLWEWIGDEAATTFGC